MRNNDSIPAPDPASAAIGVKPRSRARWFVFRCLLSVFAALLTSLGVAWISAGFLDLGIHGKIFTNAGFGIAPDAGWRQTTLHTLAGPTFVRRMRVMQGLSIRLGPAPFRPLMTLFSQTTPKLSAKAPPQSVLSGEWGTLRTKPDSARLQQVWLEDARGWPALCMYGELLETPAEDEARTVIELPASAPANELTLRILPLRPIWRGLFINAAFFGVLWAIPLMGVPLLRKAIRRRRGLCAQCGYSLAGNTQGRCPECGTACD